MALQPNEHLGQASYVVDTDGRLVVVGPNGVAIGGVGGGSGTEYTEGDVDASITGPAIMWEDTGNALVAVSVVKPLPVQVTSMPPGGSGLTDAELRATPVPVEQATAVDVSGSTNLGLDAATLAALETIGLDAATLAALETINAIISDGGGSITVDDGGTSLTIDGTVALDAGTLAALETINAIVSGTVELGATTLAALETIELGATTLAALENITVTVSGAVDTELPAAAALADNTGNPTVPGVGAFGMVWDGANWDRAVPGLTDTQLRASAVPVSAIQGADSPWSIDDNGSSLTVDAPVGTPVFARLSDGAAVLIGQKAMAASLPVVLASDQTAIPVNGDVDHDVANTLKNIQIAGHASPVDLPPTAVSANADRVRAHFDRYGANIVRRRKIRETYTATFRLAEAAARLDQTFTHVANTNKQWATLHHAATATKEIRLQSVYVWVTSAATVAPQGIIELRELSNATPPATGNPAITGRPHRIGTGAHEATALYLPTTQGSEAAANSPLGHHVFDEAVSVATVAFAHPQGYGRGGISLYDSNLEDDEMIPPTAPVGVYGGWAVVARFVGATVARLTVVMKFTEEIP